MVCAKCEIKKYILDSNISSRHTGLLHGCYENIAIQGKRMISKMLSLKPWQMYQSTPRSIQLKESGNEILHI